MDDLKEGKIKNIFPAKSVGVQKHGPVVILMQKLAILMSKVNSQFVTVRMAMMETDVTSALTTSLDILSCLEESASLVTVLTIGTPQLRVTAMLILENA